MIQKIYIAGPDVFEQDSIEIGKKLVSLCEKYGYKGLYPLDNVVDFSQEKRKIAQTIYFANVAMIDEADIVIANLNTFRGKEADSGTVWECGYAYAKGKKVYGYMKDTSPYISQFDAQIDEEGRVVEDFDYPINLMIACSCSEIIEGDFRDVLQKIKLG